jgi:hypothetical protein
MGAQGYGALAGMVVGGASNLQSQKRSTAENQRQLEQSGALFLIHTNIINQNRTQLDNELGGILSDNALKTAHAEATTKILMSTSGTVGGTAGLVSKQAYMDQNIMNAQVITQGRNQEVSMLNDFLSRKINYKMGAAASQSNILSGSEMGMSFMSGIFGGASSGAAIGGQIGEAMPVSSGSRPTLISQMSQSQRTDNFNSKWGT